MRTIIDITDSQVRALDELSRQVGESRAAVIRRAINEYLARYRKAQTAEAFGLWGEQKVDGLVYQDRARDEW